VDRERDGEHRGDHDHPVRRVEPVQVAARVQQYAERAQERATHEGQQREHAIVPDRFLVKGTQPAVQ
jgi:hypothetical protein